MAGKEPRGPKKRKVMMSWKERPGSLPLVRDLTHDSEEMLKFWLTIWHLALPVWPENTKGDEI